MYLFSPGCEGPYCLGEADRQHVLVSTAELLHACGLDDVPGQPLELYVADRGSEGGTSDQ